jgi:hypothetical protein
MYVYIYGQIMREEVTVSFRVFSENLALVLLLNRQHPAFTGRCCLSLFFIGSVAKT